MNDTHLLDLPSQDVTSPAMPLGLLLRQIAGVVRGLSDSQFVHKPVGVIQSSVGAHIRHCLDHVSALLASLNTGSLNYDERIRGTEIETSRFAAFVHIDRLIRDTGHITAEDLDRPVAVSVLLCSGVPAIEVQSTIGRELAFVINHTIHHNALLDAMVRTLGVRPPQRFGYAPATIQFLEREAHACAR
jgi:uncharacterized damage-inducible protein DinB